MQFIPLHAEDAAGIQRMSALASEIVKEHFDPSSAQRKTTT